MSNEPIDLSDWLNNAPLSQMEQGAAQAVASVTDADVDAAQAQFETAEVGTDDLLATFPAALSTPVENGTLDYTPEPLPDFEGLVQPAPALTHEETLQALDARDDALNAAPALGDDPADEPHETRLFHSMLHTEHRGIQADVRAVGDRVTLVFESLNRLETDVAAFGKMFRALLVAMEVDESELPEIPPAEPKRTRRTKKAE